LHGVGYTSGGDSWFLNIEPMAARLRVIAPDFLGWGLGDRLDREYSFAYLTDFVREFQDALGIKRSHIESPNRVDRLVLVASGGTATRTLPSMTEFTPPTRQQICEQLQARINAPVNLEELADRDLRKTQVPGALDSYRMILRHMNDPVNRARYNTLRRLPHITAPTLIVWGREDHVNAPAMGEETHRLIHGSQLVVLDGCGHSVPTERPEEFNRLLLEFLAPA
jgi:pimeloyl-ACP methyl ester carboxylesterase